MRAAITPITDLAQAHEAEPGAFPVQFFAVPEAITQGSTQEEAMGAAADALAAGVRRLVGVWPSAAGADRARGCAGRAGPRAFDVPVDPAIAARAVLTSACASRG